jgi:hypothetical protein
MAKEKVLKDWDRRETRPTGDDDPDALYLAVGKAMSAWNKVELSLAYLFGVFVNAHGGMEVAARAFGAVATTSGKLDMLKAAAEVFIGREEADGKPSIASEAAPDKTIINLKADLKLHIDTVWKGFGERRNDIAHGAVLAHGPASDIRAMKGRWYLVPSHIDPKKWERRGDPKFCYTAADVDFYVEQFNSLTGPIIKLTTSVSEYRARKNLSPQGNVA